MKKLFLKYYQFFENKRNIIINKATTHRSIWRLIMAEDIEIVHLGVRLLLEEPKVWMNTYFTKSMAIKVEGEWRPYKIYRKNDYKAAVIGKRLYLIPPSGIFIEILMNLSMPYQIVDL